MSPDNMKNMRINPVPNVITQSRYKPSLLVPITPATVAEIPSIPAIFQILEPITQPTPMSVLPDKEAIRADPNSGKDVPMAEAVTPNIIWEIPSAAPISTKLSTNISADLMTIINDTINTAMSAIISNKLSPEVCFLSLVIYLLNYSCQLNIFVYYLFTFTKNQKKN